MPLLQPPSIYKKFVDLLKCEFLSCLSVRFNETFDPRPMCAEEAFDLLGLKAYRQWKDLSKVKRNKIEKEWDKVNVLNMTDRIYII